MPQFGDIPGNGRPYGNLVYVNTPVTDRVSQQLYQEQKQRELLRQREQAQLDDDFSKNMAAIRDADVPELTKLYADWKLANQAAMKKKDGVSPEEQLQVLRKKGEMYKKIAESKAGLLEEEDLRKGIQQNPDKYDDLASDYLMRRRRLPLSQLGAYKDDKGVPLNLRDFNTYVYKGTNTDFQKPLSLAAGTPKDILGEETKDGLSFKTPVYQFGNTPLQFKQSILSSLSDRSMRRDAESIIATTPPEILKTIDEEFKAIPLEKWKRMGVDKPQDLSIDKAQSNAEKYAIHQAQLYTLNNEPKEGKPAIRDNKEAIDARNFEQQKQLIGLRASYSKGLYDYKHAGTQQDKENVVQRLFNDSFEAGQSDLAALNGKFVPAVKIKTLSGVAKKYEKDGKYAGEKVVPTFYVTKDKQFVIPRYPGESSKGQDAIPINTFLTEMGQVLLTKSANQGEVGDMLDEDDNTTYVPSSKPKATTGVSKTYSYKGKTFTREQVEKKAKENNMTVDEYAKKAGLK